MVKNKIINTLIAILLVITIFNTISAEVNTSDQRYLKILGEFDQNKTYVPVIIEVFSENMREGIISSLREDEFRFLRRGLYPTIFSGEITRGGLEKLVKNPNIKWVNLEETLSTQKNQSIDNKNLGDDFDHINRKSDYTLIFILIIVCIIIITLIFLYIKSDKRKNIW